MTTDPTPREWLHDHDDLPRQRRQWAAVSRALDHRSSLAGRLQAALWPEGPARWLVAGSVVAAVALVVGLGSSWRSRQAVAPMALAASSASTQATSQRLADGSMVAREAGCEMTVSVDTPARVESVITSGAARFDVAPDDRRVFRVVAGGVEVRVVGTAFRVAVEPTSGQVTVSVERGLVELRPVTGPGEVQRLAAGQTWSSSESRAMKLPGGAAPGSASPEAGPGGAGSVAAGPAAEEGPAGAGPAGSGAAPGARPVTYGGSGQKTARGEAGSAGASADGARALFESANQARRAGDLGRAASLYRELVRRYPGDGRAQVAALELGRLEMDGKGDLGAAEGALKAASSTGAGGAMHEDSLARLVDLYAAKGDGAACRRARDQYLASYPSGVHAQRVRGACPSP